MKCPRCSDVTLLISEKLNVEIDYCPECRGIWLDKGELDKIIERSVVQLQEERFSGRNESYEHDDDHRDRDYDEDNYKGYGNKRGNRKRSFFQDIFDF